MKRILGLMLFLVLTAASPVTAQVFTTLYLPTAGSGLTLNIAAGRVFCAGTMATYSAGTLTMTASTTNYVYLNAAASCAPAVKSTAFTIGDIPLATVVTGASSITAVTDNRSMFQSGSGSGGSMVYPSAGIAKSTGSAWATPSFSDIVALWASGSCSGYLKSDGTCGSSTGGGVQYNPSSTNYVFTGGSTQIVADQCQVAGNQQLNVSSYSVASNIITVNYTGTVTPNVGDPLMGQLFSTSTFLNGATLTVLSGVTSSTFTATLIHADTGTVTEAGVFGCAGNVVSQASQMAFLKNSGGKVYNQSVGGQTAAYIDTNYSTLLHPYVQPGSWVIISPTGNEWTGIGCPSLSSVESNYTDIWTKVHNDGGMVMMQTPETTVSNPTYCPTASAAWKALNAWIRGQGSNPTTQAGSCPLCYWDKIVTIDSVFANGTDGNLYQQSGGLAGHLTGGGARLYAEMINDALGGLVSAPGTNISDAVSPTSPCGVNGIPCTHTANTFDGGTQTIVTQNTDTVGQILRGSAGGSTPVQVQAIGCTRSSTCAFGSNVTAADTIVAVCSSTYHTGFGVTDSLGNSYSAITSAGNFDGGLYAYVASNVTGGPDTVTCIDGSENSTWVFEYSGLASSSPVDGTPVNGNPSGSPSTFSMTTTTQDVIFTGLVGVDEPFDGSNPTYNTGWTVQLSDSNLQGNIATQVGGSGTYNGTATFSISHGTPNYFQFIFALKASTSSTQSANLLQTQSPTGAVLSDVTGEGYFQFKPVPIGSLSACNAGLDGTGAAVTDSTVNTWGSTVAGGGSYHVAVYCNGTNWVVQ